MKPALIALDVVFLAVGTALLAGGGKRADAAAVGKARYTGAAFLSIGLVFLFAAIAARFND